MRSRRILHFSYFWYVARESTWITVDVPSISFRFVSENFPASPSTYSGGCVENQN